MTSKGRKNYSFEEKEQLIIKLRREGKENAREGGSGRKGGKTRGKTKVKHQWGIGDDGGLGKSKKK